MQVQGARRVAKEASVSGEERVGRRVLGEKGDRSLTTEGPLGMGKG